jgi:O-antigen ligase
MVPAILLHVFLRNRLVAITGLSYLFLAIGHIPDNIFPHGFDKNAPVQLVGLVLIATGMAAFMFIKREIFNIPAKILGAIYFLVAALLISTALSGNVINSLTGDTGRFVGVVSVLALITVALFHSQFSEDQIRKLIGLYVGAVVIVAVLGVFQEMGILTFPGAAGISSTFGNPDFFAALLGTTFPLFFYLAISAINQVRVLLAIGAVINLVAIYFSGPLQAYVDLGITCTGIVLYLVRKWIPRRDLSLNVRTFLGTFGVIIWAEGIFLVPFIGKFIPVLGNDVQVQIRSNFWLAGLNQFFKNPFFGVGPDNYGNYYEQTRTVTDIRDYTDILSNDAHSASIQTLGTLGFVGTLAFIILIALTIRAIVIIYDRHKTNRKELFAFSLFLFVYLTNSFVSPIVLSHKYLFWSICGYLIGRAYLPTSVHKARNSKAFFALLGTSTAISLFVVLNFVLGQFNWLTNVEKYASDNSRKMNYVSSRFIPCQQYFDAELIMNYSGGNEVVKKMAEDRISNSPRCVPAEILLAKIAFNEGDYAVSRKHIDRLLIIAPARNEVLKLAIALSNKTKDAKLQKQLAEHLASLGLIYVAGTEG